MKTLVLIASFLRWVADLLLRLSGERRLSRICGFCSSPVCTACGLVADGPGVRGEFCSARCRDKPKHDHAAKWSEGSFTSGMAEDGDELIRQAMRG